MPSAVKVGTAPHLVEQLKKKRKATLHPLGVTKENMAVEARSALQREDQLRANKAQITKAVVQSVVKVDIAPHLVELVKKEPQATLRPSE
ncbi:unnamed protein product [Heligmosomoides polygyrus]|uniref:Dynein light chain n=1 Tax=Heligmosomoides polygyrus TaxID=6339 RepID=A0A183G0Z4_HELPZ|nr:unnamed protein product [Heligmosomoides polygyrus]